MTARNASLARGFFIFSLAALGTLAAVRLPAEILVPAGAEWKFNDTGADLGTAWRDPAYDDSGWASGAAELGYGDGDHVTLLNYGPDPNNKYPCYYFRHTWNVANPAAQDSVKVRVVRDDGCIIYLNGVEVTRSNMPTGTVTYSTYSSAVVGGGDETAWFEYAVDPALLVTGSNVIAVEAHQCNATSSDLSFNLELEGFPPIPSVNLVSPTDQSTVNSTDATFTVSASDNLGLLDATLYLGSSPDVLVRSGPSECEDVSIVDPADPLNPPATGDDIELYVDAAVPHSHTLMKFPDIVGTGPGQIRPGVTIVSATLEVYCFNEGSILKVHRLIEDWVENEANWEYRAYNTPWTNPGADGPYSRTLTPVDGDCTAQGWRTIDITTIVQDWSNGSPNYGMVMIDSGTNGVDLNSSESANPPVLTVNFQPNWNPVETKSISGNNATVDFTTALNNDETYTWNCLVRNTGGEESWAPADFKVTVDAGSPHAPVLVAPQDQATGISLAPDLEVTVSDPDGDALDVTFYGRAASAGEEFTIIALPDTQYYSQSYPQTFYAQTQWIVDNKEALNIVFVTHEGDIVQTWDNVTEWQNADSAMSLLDGEVPYGMAPGNHDEPTNYFNQYFPYTRYQNEPWYGGHYFTSNDDSYQLFSAGGVDFIALHLDFCPDGNVITWADGILKQYPDRRAMITTHGYMDGGGLRNIHSCGSTQYIWDGLVANNDNVYFIFCGHVSNEYTRTDLVGSRQVHQLLADYQGLPNGGNGYLRILRFVPTEDTVYVETYSPTLEEYQTDSNSEFTLDFPMSTPYTDLGTVTTVPSGSNASVVWPDLSPSTSYDWYVEVQDPGGKTTVGPVWTFETGTGDSDPPVISGLAVANATATSATVTWTTDELADSIVDYGVGAPDELQVADATLVLAHSMDLTGLTEGTTYQYQVTSTDAVGNMASSTVQTFTTNTLPVAQDQTVNGDEDSDGIAITLVATDADLDPLTYTVETLPSNGALSGTAPDLTYVPDPEFNGTDSLTFKANDGKDDSNIATVTIDVASVNDPPLAEADTASTTEDVPGVIDVLANDVDVDIVGGDSIVIVSVMNGTNGLATTDGLTVTYTPDPDYSGPDSFTYTIEDSYGEASGATVDVTVNPQNDMPVADPQSVTTPEDTPLAITLTGSDVENDPLTFAVASAPSNGSLSGTAPNLTYSPNTDFNGVDSFTFTVSDGSATSAPATVTIDVTPVNDPPVADSQAVGTSEDTSVGITITGSDPDGDTLSYILGTGPSSGSLSGTAPNLTYTPAADFSGADSFTFTVSDGTVGSNIATVSITVNPVNDPPVADPQSVGTLEDTPLAITLTGSDPEGDPLSFAVASGPSNGALSGTVPNLTYTPNGNFNGADSFTFVANDGAVDSPAATVSITVDPVNDPPVANDNSATTPEDTAVAITLTASDVDSGPLNYTVVDAPTHGTLSGTAPDLSYTPDADYVGPDSFTFEADDGLLTSNVATVTLDVTPANDPPVADDQSVGTSEDTPVSITLTGSDPDAGDTLTYTIVAGPSAGTLSGTEPNLTYTPDTDFNGSDSFTFKINDETVDSNVATVSITVDPVNDPPVADPQSVVTEKDTEAGITLTGSDVDGDSLTYNVVSPPANGGLTGTAPDLLYTPESGYYGPDSFTFVVNDGTVDSTEATVSITVTQGNSAPVADDQGVATDEDTAVAIVLTASDVDLDSLTYQVVSGPANGALEGTPPSLTYTPAADYYGPDSFTFLANDGELDSNIATVSITVNPVNDDPVANGDLASTPEDTAVVISVLGNDTDVEGDTLSVSSVTQGANGSVSTNGATVTYTPAADFNGSDSFTYTLSDGNGGADTATVSVTVTPVNDPPVADSQAVGTSEDTSVGITITGSDPDGDTLSYLLGTGPSSGSLTGTPPNLTYTPNADFSGADSFTFTVSDGTVGSNIATVSITVNPVNDPPVADPQSVGTLEDTPLAITLTGSDPEGDPLSFAVASGPSNGALSGTVPNLTYTPNGNFNGADSFTFVANDGAVDSPAATVSITVTAVDDPPTTPQGLSATASNGQIDLQWTASTDPEGNLSGYEVFRSTTSGVYDLGTPLDTVAEPETAYVDTSVTNGTEHFYVVRAVDSTALTSAASNEASATPANLSFTAYVSQEPTVNHGAVEGDVGGTTQAGDSLVQTITEGPNGQAGMASLEVEYTLTTTADPATVTELTLHLVHSWTDSIDDLLVVYIHDETAPDNWLDITAGIADGSFTAITPTNHFDSGGNLRVRFTDTKAVRKETKDTLTIDALYASISAGAANTPPVADDQDVATPEDTSLPITLTGSDADGDPLTYAIVAQPSNGTLLGVAPDVTYAPDAEFNGTDSFTFQANDGKTDSNIATVTITVTPVEDSPLADDQSVSTPQDTPVNITLTGSDPDGDPITFVVSSQPSDGSLSGTAPDLTYTPSPGFNGTDSFTFTTNDGDQDSAPATVTVTVDPAGSSTIHVASITMSTITAGKNIKGEATVLVHDQAGTPVAGVTVTGNWFLNDADYDLGASAVTDAAGNAAVASIPDKLKTGDVLKFVVTDLSDVGYTYDSGSNLETEDSVIVP